MIHVGIISYLNWRQDVPGVEWIFHPANGEKRDDNTRMLLAAMGVKPGVADLIWIRRSGKWNGFAIEVKADSGELSDSQAKFFQYVEKQGFYIAIVRSIDNFIEVFNYFLKG